MSELLFFVAVQAIITGTAAAVVAGARPSWSPNRIAALSALSAPLLAGAFWLWMLWSVNESARRDACGVDSCGMAMLAVSVLLAVVLIVAIPVMAAAYLILRWLRR